jgi:predicted dehydrogenase
MNSCQNVALIGYGYWGQKLYQYLKADPHFNLRYVFFPSLKQYSHELIQKKFGKEFISEIDLIWQDQNVPSVIIATPIESHFDLVLMALLHKKHVLVEKPLTVTADQAQKLYQEAHFKGVNLETEYTYTYSKALAFIKTLVDQGKIGKIESISIELKQLGRFLSSDVYLLLGSHALSILSLFLPLSELDFFSKPLITRNNLVTAAMINFQDKNKVRGYIEINLHSPWREKKLVIYGRKGTVIYNPLEKEAVKFTLYNSDNAGMAKDIAEKAEAFVFDESHNIKYALENFYEVILKRKKPNLTKALLINQILDNLRPVLSGNMSMQ